MATVETPIDVSAEFPVLRREFDGRPVVYLDSAATSQTPQPVIDAMTRYYTESRASVHRGVYPLAVQATDLFEGARARIAGWLGSTPEETIFAANATAAINLVAYTWGRQNVGSGDLIVLSSVSPGAEIIADGHVHIYGALRGRAIAGASGHGPRFVGRQAAGLTEFDPSDYVESEDGWMLAQSLEPLGV